MVHWAQLVLLALRCCLLQQGFAIALGLDCEVTSAGWRPHASVAHLHVSGRNSAKLALSNHGVHSERITKAFDRLASHSK